MLFFRGPCERLSVISYRNRVSSLNVKIRPKRDKREDTETEAGRFFFFFFFVVTYTKNNKRGKNLVYKPTGCGLRLTIIKGHLVFPPNRQLRFSF